MIGLTVEQFQKEKDDANSMEVNAEEVIKWEEMLEDPPVIKQFESFVIVIMKFKECRVTKFK